MLLCTFVYAQELPKIIPPSPDAHTISTYGNLPLNGSSGGFSYNFPLFSLKEGSLNVNSSLNYFSNGVKVDKLSSIVGIDWSLNTGGIISRSVRDLPDDKVDDLHRWYPQYSINEQRDFDNIKMFSGDSFDTEPDWFNFNVNGISGKFYLDDKLNIKVASNKPLIIKKIMSHGSIIAFEIKDEKGVVYYLGGTEEYQEKSKSRNSCGTGNIEEEFISAWFLKKIISPKGEIIEFNYKANFLNYIESFSQSSSYLEPCVFPNTSPVISRSSCFNERMITSKVISRIVTSSGDKIEFVYNSKERKDGGRLYLKEVQLHNKYKFLQKYIFNYSFVEAKKRHSHSKLVSNTKIKQRIFLSSITKSSRNHQEKLISFSYYNKELLPVRFSFSQDRYGYYNAKNNARRPYYKQRRGDFIFQKLALFSKVGDRDVNSETSYYGMLEKITYQTKGSTEISYESNSTLKNIDVQNCKNVNLSASVEACIGSNTSVDSFVFTALSNGDINFSAGATSDTQYCNAFRSKSAIYSVNQYEIINGREVLVKGISRNDSEGRIDTKSTEPSIHVFPLKVVKGHTYKIAFSVTGGFTQISGNANFEYNCKIVKKEVVENGSGVRVKKIFDFDGERKYNEREFYYNRLKNYPSKKSSITLQSIPITRKVNSVYKTCRPGTANTIPVYDLVKSYTYKSTPINSFFTNRGNSISYSVITEINKDNNAIERIFNSNVEDNSANPINNNEVNYVPRSNNSEIHSDELDSIKYYSYKNGKFNLKKIENYKYEIYLPHKYIYSTFLLKIYDNLYKWPVLEKSLKNIAIFQYKNYFNKKKLVSKEEILYEKSTPVISKINYFYDNENHLQPTRTETTNSKREVLKTETKYAHDVNDTRLILENRIAEPLESKTYKKEGSNPEVLLSHQKTEYSDQHNPSNLYLPNKIHTSKGLSMLEDRVIYHKYDAKGNPTEVSKKDGTHIVYIWGYNQTQPVAKIENATLSQVSSYISNIQTKSNADNDRTIGASGNEGALRTALNSLRNITNTQVTTYTYDPLIGVTSITDPRGQTIYYEYDDFNRLEFVKDKDGNILKENKYNYKN